MKQKKRGFFRRIVGFTLLELMVSMVVLALLMLVVFNMLETTTKAWSQSTERVQTFKEARVAFEGLTRRIGQAMLNTYFDYKYRAAVPRPNERPTGYERKSDLHFISGRSQDILESERFPTHCVFFQAPLSFSLDPKNQSFGSLLNSWGYYIERNTDEDQIPEFLSGFETITAKERYRLMEFRPPTENFKVYASDLKTRYNTEWFKNDVIQKAYTPGGRPFSRAIAENIIALIIEPKKSTATQNINNQLAPDYDYDSRRFQKERKAKDPTKHQLPPLIDVTMVAIDEGSAIRNEQREGVLADIVPSNLFQKVTDYDKDLDELKRLLESKNIKYRVFHETVAVRASKFSDSALQR